MLSNGDTSLEGSGRRTFEVWQTVVPRLKNTVGPVPGWLGVFLLPEREARSFLGQTSRSQKQSTRVPGRIRGPITRIILDNEDNAYAQVSNVWLWPMVPPIR